MLTFPKGDRGVLQCAEHGSLSSAAVLGLLVSIPGGSRETEVQTYQELLQPEVQ